MWCFKGFGFFLLLWTVLLCKPVLCSDDHCLEMMNRPSRCPVWTMYDNATQQCKCAKPISENPSIVLCVGTSGNHTPEVLLLLGYCITQAKDKDHPVVGSCPYSSWIPHINYYTLVPHNTSQLEEMCKNMKRKGQFCGQCIDNYSLPVYSYDLQCVHCPTGTNNWGKYLATSLLPTTVFFLLALTFRFRATSPQLNGYIIICQITTSPYLMRKYAKTSHDYYATKYRSRVLSGVYFSLMNVWNLDFFRLLYSPFCLHPHASILQILCLDYVIAAYPLALIIITYTLVTFHYKGCTLVVWFGRPFRWCFAHFRRQWNIRNSLLDAFSTFLLLSYVKFLSVSFDILLPTFPLNDCGEYQHPVMYYDGTIEFFGRQHLPYAILALTMLSVFTVIPILLLCLYPCPHFQLFLNKCHLNYQALRALMDIIQGYFKNGTEGNMDCRYFASVYLMLRVAAYLTLTFTGTYTLLVSSVILILFFASISLIFPYKKNCYNKLDIVLFLIFLLYIIASEENHNFDNKQITRICQLVLLMTSAVPIAYPLGLIIYYIHKKSRRFQFITRKTKAVFLKYVLLRHQYSESPSATLSSMSETSPLLT